MHRRLRAVSVLLAILCVFAVAPALAAPGKCEAFFVIDPFCEAGKTIADKTGEVASAPVKYVAGSAVDVFTSWVADTAQWVLGRVVRFIENSTSPTLEAGWFVERYRFMMGLGALVLLPMLVLATIRAVLTQDISQLLRSFFVYLPIAILGTFVAVHLTQALLGITDAMSAAVARNVAGDVSQIFESVGGTLSTSTPPTTPGVPSFAIFLGAVLLVFGSFFVWLELLIRSAAVTVAVFFLPMILAGLVWPPASGWTKRLIHILVALILSKFVIVAVISLATAALADPGGGGFGTVMGASALMLMAAFSPFALLKMMPMVEGAAIDHLQGMGRRPIETVRPHGAVNQAVSIMRHKTRSGQGAGLAVAGARPAAGVAGGAGAAGAAVVATATKARSAAQSPGRGAERQTAASVGDELPSRSSSSPAKPAADGKPTPPVRPPKRPPDKS